MTFRDLGSRQYSRPRFVAATFGLLAIAGTASIGVAQEAAKPTAPSSPVAVTIPSDEAPLSLKDQEKQIRKLRLKFLGSINKTELRQLGIAKLRQYTDPLIFPRMLEIFRRDKPDVRSALLDHFNDQKSEEGDATLAWAAVFEKDAWYRAEASARLVKRVEVLRQQGAEKRAAASATANVPVAAPAPSTPSSKNILVDPDVPWRVKKIISSGVQQEDDTIAGAAGNLAGDLNLFEVIPLLINTQVQGGGAAGAGGGNDGALAFIMVGTQQAFVSDLTPVVGTNAVGFDPTLAVVTSGTVLRIDGASVITYRTIIHYALTRLANAAWDGRKTEPLGFDQKKWAEWYNKELLPYRQQVAAGTVTNPK
ncbi:MAG: hypothetical protein H7210_14185 [Pyrinomonadaceae bacterium]|nr:hypothetical protein [Phycisphaerales bacterium]